MVLEEFKVMELVLLPMELDMVSKEPDMVLVLEDMEDKFKLQESSLMLDQTVL
jgi:hypothetical protein